MVQLVTLGRVIAPTHMAGQIGRWLSGPMLVAREKWHGKLLIREGASSIRTGMPLHLEGT